MAFKFSKDKVSTFGPLPAGNYEVFITKAGPDYSKQKGTPYIDMQLTVRGDVDGQEQYKGRKIFHSLFFTDNTEGLVHGFLEAVDAPPGIEFDDSTDETLMRGISKFIIGRPLQVKVTVYTGDNGNDYNRVSSVKLSEYGGVYTPDNKETPPADSQQGDPFSYSGAPINISDDDLPF